MQLKNQVEWALHCCGILMAIPKGHYVSTKALAEFHGVPKEYLSKALQLLSAQGIVSSTLGPSGGYQLAKAPENITFLDIVEAIEGRTVNFQCTEIRRHNPCQPKKDCTKEACAIARIMWQADEAWRSKLRGFTLTDLGVLLGKEVKPDVLTKSIAWLTGK